MLGIRSLRASSRALEWSFVRVDRVSHARSRSHLREYNTLLRDLPIPTAAERTNKARLVPRPPSTGTGGEPSSSSTSSSTSSTEQDAESSSMALERQRRHQNQHQLSPISGSQRSDQGDEEVHKDLESDQAPAPAPAASFSPSHQLSHWSSPPRSVLLIQKPHDERTTRAMGQLLQHLKSRYPHLRIIVEPHTAADHPEYDDLIITTTRADEFTTATTTTITTTSPGSEPDKTGVSEASSNSVPMLRAGEGGGKGDGDLLALFTDLVITLGGDGTILHTSNLFGGGECPPVLSFSMGSLGFLLPFHINAMEEVLRMALNGPVSVLQRMRLSCTPLDSSGGVLNCPIRVGEAGWQVMNEVAIHRGRHPHLNVVDAYFDGSHLTEAVADGILLSTPTGSTAYSLSAGGPISHPDTDAFLLTPIAPRSLSFRTVILPGKGTVQLKISPLARSPAELSFDGREVCFLNPGESVVIKKSLYPIPCIERGEGGAASGWVKDINSLLQFNTGFRNKSVIGHGIS